MQVAVETHNENKFSKHSTKLKGKRWHAFDFKFIPALVHFEYTNEGRGAEVKRGKVHSILIYWLANTCLYTSKIFLPTHKHTRSKPAGHCSYVDLNVPK